MKGLSFPELQLKYGPQNDHRSQNIPIFERNQLAGLNGVKLSERLTEIGSTDL